MTDAKQETLERVVRDFCNGNAGNVVRFYNAFRPQIQSHPEFERGLKIDMEYSINAYSQSNEVYFVGARTAFFEAKDKDSPFSFTEALIDPNNHRLNIQRMNEGKPFDADGLINAHPLKDHHYELICDEIYGHLKDVKAHIKENIPHPMIDISSDINVGHHTSFINGPKLFGDED